MVSVLSLLLPWRWRQQVPTNYWNMSTTLHCIVSQKAVVCQGPKEGMCSTYLYTVFIIVHLNRANTSFKNSGLILSSYSTFFFPQINSMKHIFKTVTRILTDSRLFLNKILHLIFLSPLSYFHISYSTFLRRKSYIPKSNFIRYISMHVSVLNGEGIHF